MIDPPASPAFRRATILAGGLAAALAAVMFVKIAWVSDDAYIIYRSIEQLFAGNGPRWNPHERVQVFTSPLWFGYLCVFRLLSADVFMNAIVASGLMFGATLLVLRKLLGDTLKWAAAVVVLVVSNGFFDYTTSGLENPLAYFLLSLYLYQYFRLFDGANPRSTLLRLLLCGGLILTCRHDLATLVAPSAVYAAIRYRSSMTLRQWVGTIAIAMAPLAVWSVFAFIYYGSVIPNSALAKLNPGVPRTALVAQGLKYLWVGLRYDTITAVLTVAGAYFLIPSRNGCARAVGWGVALNVVYVVCVGGDFMLGRFLAFAYLVSVVSMIRLAPARRRAVAGAAIAVLLYAILYPHTPVNSELEHRSEAPHPMGVADERGAYWSSSLSAVRRRQPGEIVPPHKWSAEGRAFGELEECCAARWSVGYFGYWAGVDKRIVDLNALCDPLLARLSVPDGTPWRIGHFTRPVPQGYLPSVGSGENVIADPEIAALYDRVRVVTQATPLLSRERLRVLLRPGASWAGPE